MEKKDSPLYNIKKNYGYDINRNSGFNKKWWEIIRGGILENTAGWVLGTLVSGIITGILILLKVPQYKKICDIYNHLLFCEYEVISLQFCLFLSRVWNKFESCQVHSIDGLDIRILV
jgi:hypothetical protein